MNRKWPAVFSGCLSAVLLKPNGEVELMQRDAGDGAVTYLSGAMPGFSWIRRSPKRLNAALRSSAMFGAPKRDAGSRLRRDQCAAVHISRGPAPPPFTADGDRRLMRSVA